MKFDKVYLAWVRELRYGHDYFYLEPDDGKFYFAWSADKFGKTLEERWTKFLSDVLTEGELPEPDYRNGAALHTYLNYPTYGSEKLEDCEIYINGIFPKLKEVTDK